MQITHLFQNLTHINLHQALIVFTTMRITSMGLHCIPLQPLLSFLPLPSLTLESPGSPCSFLRITGIPQGSCTAPR